MSVSKAEKEGKSESIVEWARKCPVLWAEKVNHENMNAIVWLWGYLSEILDAKTAVVGAPPLESGVLEAKLQHALCVLEVCASHSEKTYFDNQGWKIAKLVPVEPVLKSGHCRRRLSRHHQLTRAFFPPSQTLNLAVVTKQPYK